MAHAVRDMREAEAKQAERARDLEIALREAAAIFKAELAVKGAELDTLHAELGYVPPAPTASQSILAVSMNLT